MQCALNGQAIPNLAVAIAKTAENKAKASLRGGRDPTEAAVRASEIDQAILAIAPQSANAAIATEERNNSENESDFPALSADERKRPKVSALTDPSSDDEQDFRPSRCSSPKRSRVAARVGVRAQQSSSCAEASHPSQTEAVVSLTDRSKKAEATRLAAVKEIHFRKVREEKFNRMVVQSKVHREQVIKSGMVEEEKKKIDR